MNNMNMTTEEMTMRRKIMSYDKINTRFGMKQLFLFAIVKYTTYLKIKQN